MSEKFYEKFVEPKKKDGKSKKSKGKQSKEQNPQSKNSLVNPKENYKDGNFQKKFSPSNQNHNQIQNQKDFSKDGRKSKDFNGSKNKVKFLQFKLLNSQFEQKNVPADAKKILQDFDVLIQGVRPLNSKQLLQLPDNIKELSHQLTDQRSERRLGYMNENVQLSAYVRYYTWWNLVRLTRLFSNLNDNCFPKESCICLDAGSGPLTVVTALWLARPELRKLDLTWYCLDVSSNSMAFGEDIYLSVAAKLVGSTWKIIRVKGPFGTYLKEKASFITCANMLNELDQASDMPPEFQTKKYFEQFKTYSSENAKFLLIEPGVPKSSRTLSLIRQRFINEGKYIASPCPHFGECPMNGFKAYTGSQNKWCNFAFSTEDAPAKLLKLSEKAKLPKERATLMYLSVLPGHNGDRQDLLQVHKGDRQVLLRIASDPFSVPGAYSAFYACSRLGLTLVKVMTDKKITSGDLIQVQLSAQMNDESDFEIDQKSGAKIISIG